jgi:glycosyltransferase involved in cell wall biosynthesis
VFCSTIIPTVGRPSLDRAVESVLRQSFDDDTFEVIVVNDSGSPLSTAPWQQDPRVRLLHTNRRERSAARNAGAAIARGRFLHFLDDDDWLLPDALRQAWRVPKTEAVGWYYGMSTLADRNGSDLIQLQHGLSGNCFVQVMAGEWIPLQSSFLRADVFFDVGGFNQTISGPEDIDLLRRIALDWELTEIRGPIACVSRGDTGSTTDYAAHPRASRQARESVLSEGRAFDRLWDSADHARWRGRITRIYLTSAAWNIQHRRMTEALDRAWLLLRALVAAGSALVHPAYWRAIVSSYSSEAHDRALQEATFSNGE